MVTEKKIRHLAHAIWEKEGCPEGKADEHWYKAKQVLEKQEVIKRLVAAIVVCLAIIAFYWWLERGSRSFQWWHVYVLVGVLIIAVLVGLIPGMRRPLNRVMEHVGFEKEPSKAVGGVRRHYLMALVPMYFIASMYLMQAALQGGRLNIVAMVLSIAILAFSLYLVTVSFFRVPPKDLARNTYQVASSFAIIGPAVFAIDLMKVMGDLEKLGVKSVYLNPFLVAGLLVVLGMMVFSVISSSGREQ